MDQTINEMVYRGRINSTVRSWNDQADGKNTTGGTIIASDGTTYKKVGNRLVQILDPKMMKRVKRLEAKLNAEGLVKSVNNVTSASEEVVATADTELIAEL
jgi:hypothetical protein